MKGRNDLGPITTGTTVRFDEKVVFGTGGEIIDFSLDVAVDHHRNRVVVSIDDNVAGSINFEDPLGYQESQVFLLLDELRLVGGIHIENQGIGLIQGFESVIQFALLPELLRNFTIVESVVQYFLHRFFGCRQLRRARIV